MTGMIIEFQRHHDLKRAGAYRNQPVPRQPAAEDRLGEQIFRIADLLEELEELTFGARELPPGLLAQARATIDRSGMILERCTRMAGSNEAEEDGEHDPQPDIEDELLERMYRALDDLPAVGAAMPISETLDGEGAIVAMAADSAER
jgi:hypothetical protein